MRDFIARHLHPHRRTPADFVEVERVERIFYLNYLREGMTVIDAGANVGDLTLLFSRFARGKNIHAFEASRSTFDRLVAVCNAAGLSDVILNHMALSDRSGMVGLYVYPDELSAFNSQADRPLKNYGLDFTPIATEEVPSTTIDEYCEIRKIEVIDLLKIDVEGAELQVMRGARSMLDAKKIKCMTFEFGQTTFDMGNHPGEIEELLRDAGYAIQNIVDGDPIFPGRESVATAKYSMHVAVPA